MGTSFLQALSGEAALLRSWARAPFRGRVHSVFPRTVNLLDEGGWLVALASRSVDDAPDTCVVDVDTFGECCGAGDPVTSQGRSLRVGERLVVDFAGARSWEATLPRWPDDTAALGARLAALRARVEAIEAARTSALARATAALLARRTAGLCDALRTHDFDGARAQAIALVGLGPGLTPSGDDYLVGFFAALHVADAPAFPWRTLGTHVVAQAAARTNLISYAALRAAAEGRVRVSIGRLLRAALTGSPPQADAALDAVLAIGSTSGADLAAGALDGLRAHLLVTEGPTWKRRSTSRAA